MSYWCCCRCESTQRDDDPTCTCNHDRCFNCGLASFRNQVVEMTEEGFWNITAISWKELRLAINKVELPSDITKFSLANKYLVGLKLLIASQTTASFMMHPKTLLLSLLPIIVGTNGFLSARNLNFIDTSGLVAGPPYANRSWNTLPSQTASCITASAVCQLQSAVIHDVVVGAAGNLTFTPAEVEASVGDVIRFRFLALNHTLTQSSLLNPCTSSNDFNTGFNQFNPQNVSNKFVIEYMVDSTDSQWFFCAQTVKKSHCHAGMVFALNGGENIEKFLAAATTIATLDSTLPLTTSITTSIASSTLLAISRPATTTIFTSTPSISSGWPTTSVVSPDPVASSPASSVGVGVTAVSSAALWGKFGLWQWLSLACSLLVLF